MFEPNSLTRIIKEGESFFLTGHEDPDGDSLGAILGLYHLLKSMNKKVISAVHGPISRRLQFMDSEKTIIDLTSTSIPQDQFSHAIVCDSTSTKRTGKAEKIIKNADILVNIDHHPDNMKFGHVNFVNPDASSVCEMVFLLIHEQLFLPTKSCQALACGLLYDTGNLRNPNTSEKSLYTLALLAKRGVNIHILQKRLFANFTKEDFSRYSTGLEKARFAAEGKIIWTVLTGQGTKEITQRLIEELKNVKGVQVAILFVENNSNSTKVSLRSNSSFPVNDFAGRWGGGGHKQAAGMNIEFPWKKAVKTIIPQAVKELDEWNS